MALGYAHVPVKQAVISPSALSLMYPADELPGYSREEFIHDLLHEHETEIRNCLRKGAYNVQPTSRKDGWRSRSIPPGISFTALSI